MGYIINKPTSKKVLAIIDRYTNLNAIVMEQELIHYEFINSQTGNIISYISLPAGTERDALTAALEKKRSELAVANSLYIELIYWQLHDHCIR